MPCGWEGNRRSGITLAMRHGLQWFIHLRAHDLRKEDEHPAYTTGIKAIPHIETLPPFCWWCSTVVERRSLAGELSLSCARPAADG